MVSIRSQENVLTRVTVVEERKVGPGELMFVALSLGLLLLM